MADDDLEDSPFGGQAVGALTAVSPAEQRFVRAMRLRLCGGPHQGTAWRELSAELGAEPARAAMRALEAFLWAVAQGAARRLRRHHPCCLCLGRDEALLADVVRAAAQGAEGFDRACGLLHDTVRPEARPAVIATAGVLGRALACTRRDASVAPLREADPTLH